MGDIATFWPNPRAKSGQAAAEIPSFLNPLPPIQPVRGGSFTVPPGTVIADRRSPYESSRWRRAMALLTREEVVAVLGRVDDRTIGEIIATGATRQELAEASAWLAN